MGLSDAPKRWTRSMEAWFRGDKVGVVREGREEGSSFLFNCSQQQWYFYAFSSRVLEEGMMSSLGMESSIIFEMGRCLKNNSGPGSFSHLLGSGVLYSPGVFHTLSFWSLTSGLELGDLIQTLWHNHSFSHHSFLGSELLLPDIKREVVFWVTEVSSHSEHLKV